MRRGGARGAGPWWTKVAPTAEALADVHDPVIESLPRGARDALAAVWQKRGGLELEVAAGFSAIATELFAQGARPLVLEVVAQAVRDEIHHAEISIDLAASYRGDAPMWPAPVLVHVPELAPAPPNSAFLATLHVIAMCCINETVACAVLEAALAQTKSPLVRAGLQSILSDEINHARAGWAHLASSFVTDEMKAALPNWVRRLVSGKLTALIEDEAPMPGEAFPDHGMLSRRVFRGVVRATLDDVVFPGFARAGIATAPAEAWAREAFADL